MLIRPSEELQHDLESISEEISNEFEHGKPADMDKRLTEIVDQIYHLESAQKQGIRMRDITVGLSHDMTGIYVILRKTDDPDELFHDSIDKKLEQEMHKFDSFECSFEDTITECRKIIAEAYSTKDYPISIDNIDHSLDEFVSIFKSKDGKIEFCTPSFRLLHELNGRWS